MPLTPEQVKRHQISDQVLELLRTEIGMEGLFQAATVLQQYVEIQRRLPSESPASEKALGVMRIARDCIVIVHDLIEEQEENQEKAP